METEDSLLCSHEPTFNSEALCNIFYDSGLYCEELLAPCPNSKSWRTTPFRLPAAAYSVYSQLPSTSAGSFLHPQSEDAPHCDDRDPLNVGTTICAHC